MKQILILFAIMILAATSIVAPPLNCTSAGYDGDAFSGNVDAECTHYGYDFGIAKWEWNDGWNNNEGRWELDGSMKAGYNTTASGDPNNLTWSSTPQAFVLIEKGATCYKIHENPTSPVLKTFAGISHFSLCGNNDGNVPEFGFLGAFAVLGATGLFIFFKRR